MAIGHTLGYSKSTRAKCHAPGPCKDSNLVVGTLRYGATTKTELGESVQWRHWGCVTPQILAELATTPEAAIQGFDLITSTDQAKVRMAIALRRVDPNDIPATARVNVIVANGPKQTQKPTPTPVASQASVKRKLAQAGLEKAILPNNIPFAGPSSTSLSLSTSGMEIDDEPEEEESRDELYCLMTTNVVGIQYYQGLVGPGEEVLLVREPQNKYDRNAVKVENIGRTQVGHLPKNVVSKLAPLLDQRAVTVEGVINDGNMSGSRSYTLSISLKIFGPSDQRNALEPKLVWATPGQRGFHTSTSRGAASRAPAPPAPRLAIPTPTQVQANPAQAAARMEAVRKQQEALQKAAELKQMLTTLEKVDDEGRRASLLDSLCSTDDVLSLPAHEQPPSIESGELTVNLLKHQLQGLRWCIERENPKLPQKETDGPVQFWQLRKRGPQPYYYNIATKTPQEAAPALGRGALCADAMGLGKTLMMIALILATKPQVDPGFSNSTLIVCPVSVLSNWEKQIADHCTPGTISTCTYYGTKRNMTAAELQKYDIVITTYQTLTGEFEESNGAPKIKKKKTSDRALFDVKWKRAILDEGHNIRNPKTKMAKSVVGLNASRRWVLTGTPIINSPRDLGSILTFLKICRPLDNEDFYKRLLLRPLKNGEASGAELLKALMSHICIRRTKEMQDKNGEPLIKLPPVEMIRVPVALSEEARQLYDEVEQVSKQRLENIIETTGMTAAAQSSVLSMLTRLRQIALHPGLVPARYLEDLRAAKMSEGPISKPIVLKAEDRVRLREILAQAIEDSEECPICMDLLKEPRISSCGHMYCLACIMEVISRDPKCPMDRRTLLGKDLLEPPPPTDLTQRPSRVEEEETFQATSSAKVDQLVHLLKLTPPTEKSLVFSQFTSFLDKIGERFEEEGISFVRFDGKMSAKRRQEAIARFSVPLEPQSPTTTGIEEPAAGRSTPRTRSKRSFAVDDVDNSSGDDSDFVMRGDDDDGDDFLDDDQTAASQKKGKGKAVPTPRDLDFDDSDANPRVMLLSLKAGAVGLNLTAANNVYLMDPWWQEGIESQAVDRVNRIGQKKDVHVYQLIAENTVESKVLDIQDKKKALIQQAFSGIKRTETQRQQREARLQDLVELFGIRRQASQVQA